jgi:hypothetical protein
MTQKRALRSKLGVPCPARTGRALPRALTIPTVMDLITLADVRTLIGHLPKKTRAKSTWHHVEAQLKQAAAGGDTTEFWAALQMVLTLEGVEYKLLR